MWLVQGTVSFGRLKQWVFKRVIWPERKVEARPRGGNFLLGYWGAIEGCELRRGQVISGCRKRR